MAGKPGCGGQNRLSLAVHLARNTFQPSRHGHPGDQIARPTSASSSAVSSAQKRAALRGLDGVARRVADSLLTSYGMGMEGFKHSGAMPFRVRASKHCRPLPTPTCARCIARFGSRRCYCARWIWSHDHETTPPRFPDATPHTARLLDRGGAEILGGFSPATSRHVRWRTWDAFLDDYISVRSELYATLRSGRRAGFGPLFGDRAVAYRKRFGPEALAAADYMTIREFSDFE